MDPERLMEGKFIHIGQQVSDSEGEGGEWQSHIGEMFPIGSEMCIRDRSNGRKVHTYRSASK